jgi:hypothetical protein
MAPYPIWREYDLRMREESGTSQLKRDEEGLIITQPVTDYSTHDVYTSTILLRVEYVDSQQELETGIRHQIRLLLTRQGALDVAEILRKAASRVQEPISDVQVH